MSSAAVLTRHVASRWGKEGIRCHAIAPGFTATEAIRVAYQVVIIDGGTIRR